MTDSRIDRYFAGGDLVIDLGCGNGGWIDGIRSRYARAVGIDIDASVAKSPGGRVEGWEFIHQDLNKAALPFPEGCADAVFANQVIEHVANPLHFAAEACRVLRPGGVFVVTTPNVRYLRHVMRLLFMGFGPVTSGAALRTPQVWDDGHIHFFTTRDLEWLARTAGFSRVHTEGLVATTGRAAVARRALNALRTRGLVKGFLCGNVMAVAWK
jgi:SAM-dependent methyltransferase